AFRLGNAQAGRIIVQLEKNRGGKSVEQWSKKRPAGKEHCPRWRVVRSSANSMPWVARLRAGGQQRAARLAVAQDDGAGLHAPDPVDILVQDLDPAARDLAHDGGVVRETVRGPRAVRVGVLKVHVFELQDVARKHVVQGGLRPEDVASVPTGAGLFGAGGGQGRVGQVPAFAAADHLSHLGLRELQDFRVEREPDVQGQLPVFLYDPTQSEVLRGRRAAVGAQANRAPGI